MSDDVVILDLSEFQNREPLKVNHRKSYYGKIEEYTIDGIYVRTWESTAEAAEYHNVSQNTINHCKLGKMLLIEKIGRIFIPEGSSIEERLDLIEKKSLQTNVKRGMVAIDEYDINGNYVRSYPSISAISVSKTPYYPSGVKNICSGKVLYSKTSKRIFLESGASIKARLELIKQAEYNAAISRSIDEYSKDGTLIKYWKSVSDISAEYGISSIKILDCCFGKSNSIKGKIFLFSGEDIKKRLKIIKSKKKII